MAAVLKIYKAITPSDGRADRHSRPKKGEHATSLWPWDPHPSEPIALVAVVAFEFVGIVAVFAVAVVTLLLSVDLSENGRFYPDTEIAQLLDG